MQLFFLARHTISFYSSSFRFPQKNVQWICFVYLFDQNGKKFPLVFLYWITKEMVSIWCKFSGLPLSWPFDGYSILCTIPFCSTHVCSIPVFFFVIHSGKPLACGCWIVFAWHASQIYQKASWVWYLCVEGSKELSVSDIISVGIPLFSPCFTSSCSFPLSVNFGTLQMRWKHHICSIIIIIIVMHGWIWFDEFSMVDRTRSERNLSYQIIFL